MCNHRHHQTDLQSLNLPQIRGGGGRTRAVQAGNGLGTVLYLLTGAAQAGAGMEGQAGCQTLSAPLSCRNFALRYCLHCIPNVGEHQRYD